jgi:hypothetical protein
MIAEQEIDAIFERNICRLCDRLEDIIEGAAQGLGKDLHEIRDELQRIGNILHDLNQKDQL